MVKNGRGQSGYGTLKLTVSQEWIDGMSWYFTCWCKFRKAKSYFNDFWVGMVRTGRGHLVNEALNPLYLKSELTNSADFLHADCEAIIFGKTDIVLCIFNF